MKKVFLSLAVIAALTVVSCKQAEAPAEEAPVTEEAAPMMDTTAMPAADTTAAMPAGDAAATPAADAPAMEKKDEMKK